MQAEKDAVKSRQAEEALKEREERLRTILESVPAGIMIIDAESHTIVDVNPAAVQVIGIPKKQIVGQMCHNFICPEDECQCPITDLGQTMDNSERVLIRADGESVPILKTVVSVFVDGRKHLIESFLDISGRKQAEEALQKAHDALEQRVEQRTSELVRTSEQLKLELTEHEQAEEALRLAHRDLTRRTAELESANEELYQYNQVVAHVLKRPLRAICNYADFLRQDLEAILNGDHIEHLDDLDRAVSQGVELVDNLLKFSTVGRRSQPTKMINIGGFLRELIAPLNMSGDVEVVMANDWPTIEADPILLRHVFQDLIRNAIKFNNSPCKRLKIGWRSAGDDAYEFFLRDNGIGIEPRCQDQIFGIFERLHTGEEYNGTGLGLAIVRKAASKLGGSVRVESKVGEGSTFSVVLPKMQKAR